MEEADKCTVTYSDIIKGLKELEFSQNPVILVHSSLKSFGKVEGGAETLIHALLDLCGEKGTLVMPTLTFASVNEADPFFDAAETPSGTGYVTEFFRKKPGVIRSMHVLSSAAAFGYDAAYITEAHFDSPCGPETPYGRIIELKGYSLFLGVDFGCNTLFHCAEEAVNPAYLKYKTLHGVRVRDFEGNTSVRDYRRYDCYQTGIFRKLEKMGSVFMEKGVLHETLIGNSHITMISAEDNFRISCEVLRSNPEFILE